MMRIALMLLVVLITGGSANARQATDCQVIDVCEGKRCVGVPGQFVQIFRFPRGGIGETKFYYGTAYVFSSYKDVVPAIEAGQVSRAVRYVVWPDETGRGGQWLDAGVFAVKRLTWDGDKPSLSAVTSLMSCESGNG